MGEADGGEKVFGVVDAVGNGGVVVVPAGDEGFGLVFECEASFDDFGSDGDVTGCRDIDGEAEAVEELGAEFAFFGGSWFRRARNLLVRNVICHRVQW